MAVETNSSVSSAQRDGAINIVKIKTAGSGGTDGTFTNILLEVMVQMEGTIVVSSGAVTSVTVTNAGTGYTFEQLVTHK